MIMFDCKFSQELKQIYPGLIMIISSLEEIDELEFNWKMAHHDWALFLKKHSFYKICESVRDIWDPRER